MPEGGLHASQGKAIATMKTKFPALITYAWIAMVPTVIAQAPVIVTPPQPQTNAIGTTATLTVVAMGTPPLSYQWSRGSSAIPGATIDTLVLTNVMADQSYMVVVSNPWGSVTNQVINRVGAPAGIATQPMDTGAEQGFPCSISVVATGRAPIFYQWYKDSVVLPGQTNSAINFASVQTNDTGLYRVTVQNAYAGTNLFGGPTSREAELRLVVAGSTFSNITTGPVVNDPGNHWGPSWADYDNDGHIDLMIPYGYPNLNTIRLFRNQGNGTFERMGSNQVGNMVSDRTDWLESTWADIDNDGWLDVFVGAWEGPLAMFRNNGTGGFTWIMDTGLPLAAPGHSEGLVWADFDRDGFVDAYLGVGQNLARPTLYRNDGTGRFIGVTNGPLNRNLAGWMEGASWSDYDNDGWMDLVVTYPPTEGGPGVLQYHNEGGGVFTQLTNGALREISGSVLAHVWGDYDNDGLLDVFVGRYSAPTQLLHNDGAGQFHQIPLVLPSGVTGNWGDYDNDGDLDLVVCLTNAGATLLQNNGDGSFAIMTSLALAPGVRVSQGAWGDYDNDGFLDLVLTPDAFVVANTFLYRNNGNSNHWLMFKLEGTLANRAAIGAKVRVQATIGGRSTWQVRELSRPYRAHDDLRAHFGLGDADKAEIVRVEWPSGQVTVVTNVTAGQILTVTESPQMKLVSLGGAGKAAGGYQLELKSHPGMMWDLYRAPSIFDITEPTNTWGFWKSVTNLTGAVSVTDTNVSSLQFGFYKAVAKP
jgi:enediyne biosynthesis protein E4